MFINILSSMRNSIYYSFIILMLKFFHPHHTSYSVSVGLKGAFIALHFRPNVVIFIYVYAVCVALHCAYTSIICMCVRVFRVGELPNRNSASSRLSLCRSAHISKCTSIFMLRTLDRLKCFTLISRTPRTVSSDLL